MAARTSALLPAPSQLTTTRQLRGCPLLTHDPSQWLETCFPAPSTGLHLTHGTLNRLGQGRSPEGCPNRRVGRVAVDGLLVLLTHRTLTSNLLQQRKPVREPEASQPAPPPRRGIERAVLPLPTLCPGVTRGHPSLSWICGSTGWCPLTSTYTGPTGLPQALHTVGAPQADSGRSGGRLRAGHSAVTPTPVACSVTAFSSRLTLIHHLRYDYKRA